MSIFANVLALALIAAADEPKPAPPMPAPAPAPEQTWQMTLPEAIRIGLDNSEVIRVLSVDPTPKSANAPEIVIARLNVDASVWNFKAAVMAHVRSIEQQFWVMSYLQVNVWARETAVKLGEEILARERAALEIGQATRADVAEAQQQLENFKLNLVSATSDLITTERQLRNILGLPASDGRRIIANASPLETRIVVNPSESLIALNESQPDVVQQRSLVGLAELQMVLAADDAKISAEQKLAAQNDLARQREFMIQILRQTTRSLARFTREVDSSFDQFQTAQKLLKASKDRLEAQRAFYEEGRITIDRLLDAIAQYANAVAQEAQYKSTYNTAIAALEEAKGTLLIRDKITIADGPAPRTTDVRAKDDRLARASFEPPVAPPTPAKAPAPSTTYKLRAKLGLIKVLDLEFEICPGPAR